MSNDPPAIVPPVAFSADKFLSPAVSSFEAISSLDGAILLFFSIDMLDLDLGLPIDTADKLNRVWMSFDRLLHFCQKKIRNMNAVDQDQSCILQIFRLLPNSFYIEVYHRPLNWQFGDYRNWRPRLTFYAVWSGPNLQMTDDGSVRNAFLPDGSLNTDPPHYHDKMDAVPVSFVETNW